MFFGAYGGRSRAFGAILHSQPREVAAMLLLLINIVIVIVVGAIFVLSYRQVCPRRTVGEPAQDPGCIDLPRGDPAAAASDYGGGWAIAGLFVHTQFAVGTPP
jgi:hypothetical protein